MPDRQQLFSFRAGNRWSFAVEFEAFGDRPGMWNEWWGSLWLWVNGHVVGRPFEIEMVASGLDPLTEGLFLAAQNPENRTGASLAGLPPAQALDLVMRAEDDEGDSPQAFNRGRKLLALHEVIPRGSPFFDGWEALLITEGSQERFIFRQEQGEAGEARWPEGTFRIVVVHARSEFEKLAKAHILPISVI
jgi:hypothetical protein